MTEIQALVHDVFGTVVDWRAAVTADGEALAARKGITGVDWQKFAVTGLREDDKIWFNLTWHRLKPWPDSVPGLTRIKQKYIIATLSNGTVRLLTDMAKHCGLPWDTVLGSDVVRHYKPDAEMYQSAIEFLGSGDPSTISPMSPPALRIWRRSSGHSEANPPWRLSNTRRNATSERRRNPPAAHR